MSGIEVAGLLLGAIPLIVEGYESSQKALRIFKTYRHYPAELRKLETKLDAQRASFRNACKILLTEITKDSTRVHEMFADTSHSGWTDTDLLNRVASQCSALDESFTSCIRTTDEIDFILNDICQQMTAYQTAFAACDEEGQKATINKDKYRKFMKRLQLGFNKNKLEGQIKELRRFNMDLNILSDQIVKSIKEPSSQNSNPWPQKKRTPSSLSRYHHVQKASQRLYETLVNRWSCSLHSRHSANLSLAAAEDILSSIALSSQTSATAMVRLEMAITYQETNQTGNIPIWLKVESPVDATSSTVSKDPGFASFQEVSVALETHIGSFVPDSSPTKNSAMPPRTKKAVRFDNGTSSQPTVMTLRPTPVQVGANSATENSIDLCLLPDVCGHFQSLQPDPQQELCVGHLKDTYTQRFYSPPAGQRLNGGSKSLEDVITWVSEKRNRVLPRPTMFHLAYSLATAVLQFHSTPWLSNEWQSRDVVFFGMESFSQSNLSLKQPHLNRGFCRTRGKSKATIGSEEHESMSSTSSAVSGARNEILFRLGVILLEIGFVTPWSTLRSETLQDERFSAASDYVIADKLARLVASSMGPSYSKVVRKCLGCDFGLGETDLASEELQARVLLEVVDTLEGLAKKLASS